MSGVTLKEETKSFDETKVIHGVNLEIPDGELCVFVGPSGCGKSTLLRMIAGLEQVTSGSIEIGSRDVTTADPADRGVAMVFQNYALYPHMTVAENMGFGLKMNGVAKNVVKEKVLTLLLRLWRQKSTEEIYHTTSLQNRYHFSHLKTLVFLIQRF